MYECRRSGCEKEFEQANNRCRHERKCTKGEIVEEKKPVMQCQNPWCMKTFDTNFNLNRHFISCSKKMEKTFKVYTAFP